jgi:ribonuclease T1
MQGKPVFLFEGLLVTRAMRKLALALSVLGVLLTPIGALAKESLPQIGSVAWAHLPIEAQATGALIRAGGPFPYSKDGAVFANRERLLPSEAKGYYREYTVKTPGARDRGARRIVCGGQKPTTPDACFYTGDHYASFARIAQ